MSDTSTTETSVSDVPNRSDVQRLSLQSDVESSSITESISESTGSVRDDMVGTKNHTFHDMILLRRTYGELISLVEQCKESEFDLFSNNTEYHYIYSLGDDACSEYGWSRDWKYPNRVDKLTFEEMKELFVERMMETFGNNGHWEFARREGMLWEGIVGCEFQNLRTSVLSEYFPDDEDSSDFYSYMWNNVYGDDNDHWCEVMDIGESTSVSKCDDGDDDGVREELDEFMCNPEYYTEFREYLYGVMKEERHPQVLMKMIKYHHNTLVKQVSDDSVVIN